MTTARFNFNKTDSFNIHTQRPFNGVAVPVARLLGIALIALSVACWPGTPLVGMLIYSASVSLYLA